MKKLQSEVRKLALAAAALLAMSLVETGNTNEEVVDAVLWAAKAIRRQRAPRSIYVLRDPRDSRVRYVGCAIDTAKRLKGHWTQSTTGDSDAARWVRELRTVNLRPLLEVVAVVNAEHWESEERRWVAHFREDGCDLLNSTDGGAGAPGWSASARTRERMSNVRTGVKQSESSKEKTRSKLLGMKRTPECRAAMSAARKGKIPVAACAAAALATRGKPKSAEHRSRIGAANKGRANRYRKLSPQDAEFVRRSRGILSQRELARRFSVGLATIHAIQNGLKYVADAVPAVDQQRSLFA